MQNGTTKNQHHFFINKSKISVFEVNLTLNVRVPCSEIGFCFVLQIMICIFYCSINRTC